VDLLNWSTSGDSEMKQSLKRLWEAQGDRLTAKFGPQYDSWPVWGCIDKAIAATRISP
jgi:hypothetical protein